MTPLELDLGNQPTENCEKSDPAASNRHRDPVLADLRGNLHRFSARHRQGARDRRTMFSEEAVEFAGKLRRQTADHHPLGIACSAAALLNLSPNVVPDLVHRLEPGHSVLPALHIDLHLGRAHYDLDRVLESGGRPLLGCLPASRWVSLALPGFLLDELRARQARQPSATTIEGLIGRPEFEGRSRLFAGPGHRLKFTLARFKQALGPLLLDLGVHPAVASTALIDFGLSTRSNFAYFALPVEKVEKAVAALHSALGWD